MQRMKEQESNIMHEKVGRLVCSWMEGALVWASGEPNSSFTPDLSFGPRVYLIMYVFFVFPDGNGCKLF